MRLDGKKVAAQIKTDLIERCIQKKEENPDSKIVIFRLGNKSEDLSYERRVLKNCNEIGLDAKVVTLDETIQQKRFLEEIKYYNEMDSVLGILIFRPLPKYMDERVIGHAISPEKDIDCMNPLNLKKLFLEDVTRIAPCTPEAVMELLKYYDIPLKSKHVVIVNRSMVLGKPLALLFLEEDATVTLCHSKTEDLVRMTSQADIVVTGIGKPNFFGKEYFKSDAIVIDVGINFTQDGMCGDVNFEAVTEHVASITPVPGGIGAVTSMILLKHALRRTEK